MTPATALHFLCAAELRTKRHRKVLDNAHATFGLMIASERAEKGIPAADLAQKLGVSAQMLGYMESGRRRWPLITARKAAALVGRAAPFIDPWPSPGSGKWRRKHRKPA